MRTMRCQTVLLVLLGTLLGGCGSHDDTQASPAGLTYSNASVVFVQGKQIVPDAPSSGGGTIERYSVSPPLPPGLDLDPRTGVIAGTPTATSPVTVYTVTGRNAAGRATARLRLGVEAAVVAPQSLSYRAGAIVYQINVKIVPDVPIASGGQITQYSVSPALPAGLGLDAATGIISGTPIAISPVTVYTVTGSNAAGSATAWLQVEVAASAVAPVGLGYRENAIVYDTHAPIVPNAPGASGGEVTHYSATPALPDGLSLDAHTGVIAGTPTATSPATSYTLTGSNPAGSATSSVEIEVAAVTVPPASLSYRDSSIVYVTSAAIVPNMPAATGGEIVQYSVTPALPAGLGLDPDTGIISGTPTAVSRATVYTVTGANAAGSDTARLQIEVKALVVAPDTLFYQDSSISYVTNAAIVPNTPISSGGEITHYSVAPALPSGLGLNAETGIISGTPTTAAPSAIYTVTGSNSADSVEAQLELEVQAQVTQPTSLTYEYPAPVYTVGLPIVSNDPLSSGAEIARFSVSPALPAGLNIDAHTGVISGTPSAAQARTTFIVTGSNSAGSVTAPVAIAVAVAATGEWLPADAMNVRRSRHTATLLADGRVLVAGGTGPQAPSTAELYDPAADAWSPTGDLVVKRQAHSATRLPDGSVLVAGGFSSGGGSSQASAELYDPASGTWSRTGTLGQARDSHTATLLPNGQVLVAGGEGEGKAGALSSAELYDPTTRVWSPTGRLGQARYLHTATLLPDGRLLVAGGLVDGVGSASAELYDPATGIWSPTASMSQARTLSAAALLPDGRVLVAGGTDGAAALSSAELYDPVTGSWAQTGNISQARHSHTLTLLANGSVLVAGGQGDAKELSSDELYDPGAGTWSGTGDLGQPRSRHTATLLVDGSVLVTGGVRKTSLSSAELFH